MATDIVGSLFGVTPELYQQQRDLAEQRQAMAFAQQDPRTQATYGLYRAGQQLGGALGGLMGAEDPQMRLISQRNALAKQFDVSTPEGLAQYAGALQQIGDTQGALEVSNISRKAASEVALAKQRMFEKQGVDPIQQLIRAGKHYPASIALYAKSGNIQDLELIEKPVAEPTTDPIKNARAIAAAEFPVGSPEYTERYKEELKRLTAKEPKVGNVKEVGVAMGSREPVYLDVNNDQQYIYQKGADGKQMRVPYFGGVDRTTATTKVQVDAGENEFRKRLGVKDADRVDNAMTMKDSSIAALNSLNRLNQLDQNALISGTFATGRVGATNLLNTLGLTSAKDADNLSKSENYQKTAGDVILATLGGKLGAGFSNEDRRFIQGLVPQLENSPQARKQLIEFMVNKNQSIVQETTRLETYARDNNGLKGYVPKIPIFSGQSSSGSNALQGMSIEQLQNMLKNAQPTR
jgi:hypothetical protein